MNEEFAAITENDTNIIYKTVVDWFGNQENFIQMHKQIPETNHQYKVTA